MLSFIPAAIPFIAAICVLVTPAAHSLSADIQYAISAFLIVASVFFMIWPQVRKQDIDAIETLPGALEEVRKLGREYYRNTSAIQENSTAVKELAGELLPLKKPLDELLIERRQELMNVKNELTEWQKVAIRHFEYLHRSFNLDGIDEIQRQTYQKASNDYMRELKTLGFEIIQPAVGDQFDEHFHECRQEEISENLNSGQIISVEGIGYCLQGRCYRPVPVIIAKKAHELFVEHQTDPLIDEAKVEQPDFVQDTESLEKTKTDTETAQ